jgi:hypothetical protein
VEKYYSPFNEKYILPLSATLLIRKAHKYTRGNKT